MKKIFFYLTLCYSTLIFAQEWSPSSATVNTNIFRNASVGIGYTTAPTFGTNKFMVNGNAFFSGNVGVGITAPSEKLDINGNIKSKRIICLNTNNSSTVFANSTSWYNSAQVLGVGFQLPGHPLIPNTNSYMFEFLDLHGNNGVPNGVQSNNNYLAFNINDRNGINRLLFDAHTGGDANGRTLFGIRGKNQDEIIKVNDDGLGNVFMHLPKDNSRIVIAGWGNYLPQHKFVVRGSSMIEGNILTDSNIGIGTNNFTDGTDTYRLSVNGAVRANRVRVYTNWADYVFEKDYYLPTLEEVENHINEKGHLIDIPSSAEVEEKGIELGEMNKLLLQKIEELTLYIINLNKEIQTLKNQQK